MLKNTVLRDIEKAHLNSNLLLVGLEQRYQENAEQNDKPIAKGQLSFEKLSSGIGIHCTDLIEEKNASSTALISPCLSVTILLNGKISYRLAQQYYEYSANESPCAFVNVLTRKEVFTRYLSAGQVVKKVNITIEEDWLLARCNNTKERALIKNVFSGASHVQNIACDIKLTKLALNLLSKNSQSMNEKIYAEKVSLELISHFLPQFFDNIMKESELESPVVSENAKQNFELGALLDKAVDSGSDLKQIAGELGVSISTLQRKIKATYQMTAIEYLRIKRLERAKKLFIIDGKSIGEAAYAAGYSHVANFITAFKKQYNSTPAQLRMLHLEQ